MKLASKSNASNKKAIVKILNIKTPPTHNIPPNTGMPSKFFERSPI